MFDAVATLYLYVETPLHAGVGSGLSAIDLPIQRERPTQYPMIQGSAIKGKLRSVAEAEYDRLKKQAERSGSEADKKEAEDFKARLWAIFGPDTDNAKDYASALVVGDARILLFPVRSLAGVYAYVTSADVLNRFKRDFERERSEATPRSVWQADIAAPAAETALVPTGSNVLLPGNSLVLEEFSYRAETSPELAQVARWIADQALPANYSYWRTKIQQSLVLLPENDFRDFALYGTEIITRVRLDREKKTVAKGALWTEEHLPTDTLLYAPVYASGSRKDGVKLEAAQVLERVQQMGNGYVQLGGDETVGRGMVCLSWQMNGGAAR
jgi:CRISPR-associated protein Cmr4